MIAKSRLFSYLEKLDKEDTKQIQRYLQSPFFKVDSRDRVIQLFDYIKKFHPDYDIPKLSNEALERKMKFTNYNNVKSALVTCIEEYLTIKAFKENEYLNTYLFSKTLNELNLESEFQKFSKKEIEKLNRKEVKSEEDYYLKYKLLREMFGRDTADMLTNKNTFLEQSISALDHYYLHTNLKNLLAYNNLSLWVNRKSNADFAKKIIHSIDFENEIEDFNIKILHNLFLFNEQEDVIQKEIIYENMRQIVKNNYKKFPKNYKYEVYVNVLNMATKLHVLGINDYANELFNVHKFWIEKKVRFWL